MTRLRPAVVCVGWLLVWPAIASEDHAAGYRWALAKGIDDPFRCVGKSPAFEQGCREAALAVCTAACVEAQQGDEATCETRCDQ